MKTMRYSAMLAGLMLCLPFAAQAEPKFVHSATPDLPTQARGVPKGGALHVFDMQLDERNGAPTLELERFDVFAPDAKIEVVGGKPEKVPDTAYFRGRLSDDPQSTVLLAVPKSGKMRGIVNSESGAWMLESKDSKSGLKNRKVDLEKELAGMTFKCGTENKSVRDMTSFTPSAGKTAAVAAASADMAPDIKYTASIIVDTDYEFYKKFGDKTKAKEYVGDLIAYASIPYEREVQTNLLISKVVLVDKSNKDPYNGITSCDKLVSAITKQWSNNNTPRTLVHLLSGKNFGCGQAAVIGGLCSKQEGYSVSSSIGSSFNINNPKPMWEGYVVAHEIGHNFKSRHTHAYCNIGGVADPVDICSQDSEGFDPCVKNRQHQLPGISSLEDGTPGTGNGTLMSYCHQVSDDGFSNFANISHTFGKDHPYGVAAYRVPNEMLKYVASKAACMPPLVPDFITEKVKMTDSSGVERYTYKINETADVHAWVDNIGTADWDNGNAEEIKVSFYLSKGQNEDPHSEWIRAGRENIQKDNLEVKKNAKHERITFSLAQWAAAGHISDGQYYNFVVCADRPEDQDNGYGWVKELHESNNCSKETVFYVEPLPKPDLTAHSLQLNSGSTTFNGGSLYGLTVNVRNGGNGSADSGFQIKYEIKGPSTGGLWKTVGEKSFTAVPLAAGANQQIKTGDDFAAAPAVAGDYLLRACADSTQAVTESNESNNCSGELAVSVGPSLNPSLKPVYRFRDYAHSSYFYTASEDEKNLVIDKYSYLWTYQHIEHCALPAQESGSVPVYRFRADIPAGTFYFYTASEAEKDHVVADYPDLWKYQGVVWYAYDHEDSSRNTVPVHRFRADTASAVFYFYTASEAEKDHVIASYPDLWKYQGIAWYGFQCP